MTKQLRWSSSSCPSSVDVERADVDQNSSDNLMPPSSSLLYSTPSLSLSELVSHVIESSGSVLSPLVPDPRVLPHQSSSDLPSATQVKRMQDFSSVTTSSSPAVEAVTSAMYSVSLSDSVFLGTSSSSSNVASSSELIEPESSLSTCSECVCSSSRSSDGIRGVWYYLTSSQESSETSLNTTMPTSTTASSSSCPTSSSCLTDEPDDPNPVTSSSVIYLSSDMSSADGAEMVDGDPSEPSKSLQKCSVSYVSDCSSGESDIIYVGATKSVSDPSDKGANNSNDSTSMSNVNKKELLTEGISESREGLRDKTEKEEVGEEAMPREKVLELENQKTNSGDISVRGAAGLMATLKKYSNVF